MDKAEILRERARLLAQEAEAMKQEGEYCTVVEFLLADERYAFELACIREVCPLKELTPIPCTPSFVLGIVNFRGQILSVIDIKKFFDIPGYDLTNLNRIIILHSDEMEFGVLADEVLGVRSILLSEIQPSVPTFTGIRAEYLKGVTKDRVVILNGEKILADKNIIVQ
ncbi:MAG: purine-binding chemotaxis protein CheW [Desulfobacterales bacterium]|nr:purine-binding chemotaxis protein CheW [Desulfobacterales bacterium]